MSPELQKELLTRLDALAERLGTKAEYLWAVLVREQFVNGITGLVTGTLFLAASIWGMLRIAKYVYRKEKSKYNESLEYALDDDSRTMCTFLLVVTFLLGVGISFCCFNGSFAQAFVPEAAAFRVLLQSFR